jgi:hypothetical protein
MFVCASVIGLELQGSKSTLMAAVGREEEEEEEDEFATEANHHNTQREAHCDDCSHPSECISSG